MLKISQNLKNKAKKLGIRLTTGRKQRIPKSEKVLKQQIANANKKKKIKYRMEEDHITITFRNFKGDLIKKLILHKDFTLKTIRSILGDFFPNFILEKIILVHDGQSYKSDLNPNMKLRDTNIVDGSNVIFLTKSVINRNF